MGQQQRICMHARCEACKMVQNGSGPRMGSGARTRVWRGARRIPAMQADPLARAQVYAMCWGCMETFLSAAPRRVRNACKKCAEWNRVQAAQGEGQAATHRLQTLPKLGS